jgi:hypothetical protein
MPSSSSVTGVTPLDCTDVKNHGTAVSQAAHDAKAGGEKVGPAVRDVARNDVGKKSTSASSTASTDYTGMSTTPRSSASASTNKQVATTRSAKDRAKARENTRNLQSEEQQKDEIKKESNEQRY